MPMAHLHIRLVLLVVLAITGLSSCRITGPDADTLYGQRIVIDADGGASLTNSAKELSHWLEQSTSAKFEVTTVTTNRAIFLFRTNSALVASADLARLKEKGREAFVIRSEGAEKLWIVGNSDTAVRHGVYFYLEQLDCRWFLPNDRWTIIPARKSVGLKIDRVVSPAFRARNFFGTGGFGGKLPVDPNMTLQARWEKWKEQNRFGGDIQIGGHTGEAFLIAHKAEFEAHPEYLAEIGGKRQPLGATTKLCVSNPGLRALYVKDRLAAFQRAYDRNPDAPSSMAVSVEPADGGGHCECAECLKIGSVSDRVFFLANAVAKEMAVKHAGRYASLLAYHEHAAVPQIPLEPSLYVFVVPYGFQRTGLPGDELLQAWGGKHRPIGIYDYWAITDWANCLPTLSVRTTVPKKIRLWSEQGANAFLGESSFCAGNVGLVWYVASRLMWDPQADVDALLDDFHKTAFGPAEAPMRRMLERWAAGFLLSEHELGLCFQDLAEARRLATDPDVRARVDDFALYVHYVRLWHEYQSARGDDRRKAARALVEYMWRIYDSAMVHSYRMFQLISLRYEKGDKELFDEWPLKNANADVWKKLTTVDANEIAALVADGAQRYRPLQFEERKYSKQLVPLTPPGPRGTKYVESPTFTGGHRFQFWMEEGASQVEVEIRVSTRGKTGDRVTVTDPRGATILKQTVPPDGQWHTVTIPNRSPGAYRMEVFDQKVFFDVKVPASLPFVIDGGFACPDLSSRVCFYVPKGLRRLALHAETVAPIKLFDGDNNEVTYEGRKLILADVPTGQDGRIWALSGFKSYTPLRPLNFPAAFAFSHAGLMVPEELVPKREGKED